MYIIIFISRFFLFFFLLSGYIFAQTNLSCATYEQTNLEHTSWACPAIDNNNSLKVYLADVDVESGIYSCVYHYRDTYKLATACTYISKQYQQALKSKIKAVKNDIIDAVENENNIHSFKSFYPIVSPISYLENQQTQLNTLYTQVADDLMTLSVFHHQVKGVNSALSNATNLDTFAKGYTNLVKPYVSTELQRNEDTFARFMTGVVTLDPKVIRGYDEKSGKPMVSLDWNLSTETTIISKFMNYFNEENDNSQTVDIEKVNVHGWLDIFEQRIWGFYYNLQRRLDIGYSMMTTQLLFLMMAFFAIVTASRGGARYITNREFGDSSGEVKVNEESIMKTLGVLATVFIFYLAVPSGISSENTVTKSQDIPYEMKGNNSLIKGFIRYTMEKGSYFGTMVSDLGTDAFLHYLLHTQGLNNGLKERNNMIRSVENMVYYFPALQIANECRRLHNIEAGRFVSGEEHFSINPQYAGTSSFLINNRISDISYPLCRKMLKQTEDSLSSIAYDTYTLQQMIQKDLSIRLESVKTLVNNHLLLQNELGWINVISIPYTYFMMKHQELFFQSSLDLDQVEEKTRKYINNLGLHNAENVKSSTWMDTSPKIRNSLEIIPSSIEQNRKESTRVAMYYFLPGFSSIREDVFQRLEYMYQDISRAKKDNMHQDIALEYEKHFLSFLEQYMAEAQRYYYDANQKSMYSKERLTQMIRLSKNNPILLHQTLSVVSEVVAINIWKSGFIVLFLSLIAILVGLKVLSYFIRLLIHFFIAPFMVLWAFATSIEGGLSKVKRYLGDTLIYMIYPSLIVLGVFIFIFSYELLYTLYGFVISVLIDSEVGAISKAIFEAKGSFPTASEMHFLSLYALESMIEILIDIFSLYIAFITISKFPEWVLEMAGVNHRFSIVHTLSSKKGVKNV